MPFDRTLLSPGQVHLPGILGGLGPLSHVQFERVVLARSHARGARSDRAHPVWLLASASATPERTKAILEGGESPVRHLTAYAQLLERGGAEALFVVCNTAHAFYDEVQRGLGIPWVHLMRLVAAHIRANHPAGTAVGLLATDGTLKARLYHDALADAGLVAVAPDEKSPVQAKVRAAIGDPSIGIKATGDKVTATAKANLAAAAEWCVTQGAKAIVLGCTEVSVGLTPSDFAAAPLVDPLAVAADALLDFAYGQRAITEVHGFREQP